MLSSLVVSDTPDGTPRAQTRNPARRFVDLSDSTITSFFSFVMVIDTQILTDGRRRATNGKSSNLQRQLAETRGESEFEKSEFENAELA